MVYLSWGKTKLAVGEVGAEVFYCAAWVCETSVSTSWLGASKEDLVSFTHTTSGESEITITFTEKGKKVNWLTGNIWGLRLYNPGGEDIGILFTLRIVITPPMTMALGPNPVLPDQGQLAPAEVAPPLTRALGPPSSPKNLSATPASPLALSNTGQQLFNLIMGAFSLLNSTDPNMTESCWLCLSAGPPYYEGIAISGGFNNTTSQDGYA